MGIDLAAVGASRDTTDYKLIFSCPGGQMPREMSTKLWLYVGAFSKKSLNHQRQENLIDGFIGPR
jgi:hypothetical protein